MKPIVECFFDNRTNTATYLIHCSDSGDAAIVDPVLGFDVRSGLLDTNSADALIETIESRGLSLRYILETHAHADHLSAADYLRSRTGAKIVIGKHITDVQTIFAPRFGADDVVADGRAFDILIDEGDRLPLGGLEISVVHTPGHTPADVSYRIGDALFVGDTMFMPDYGTARADFPGGDARVLYRSIRKLLALSGDLRMFVGHDYLPDGRSDYRWETSVADQRAHNIHVHDGIEEDDFVSMREARDATLAPPTLLLPSLQVNIRAGALPPPEADGKRFLRLPITMAR